jgi:hypothetical protein
MSRKRKAEGLNSSLSRKISPNAISTVPLSAFAAAKAKAQNGHLARLAEMGFHEESLETLQDETEVSFRKDSARTKIVPSTTRGEAHEEETDISTHSGALSEWARFLEPSQRSNHEDLAIETAGLEQETTIQAVQMSSWTPTSTNVVSCTTKAERLHLSYGQTLAVLGHYKLRVLDGLIIISGTFLTPSSTEQEIFTTSMFALPPIKCISSAGAMIELSHLPTRTRSLQNFQRLSPLFGDILFDYSKTSSFTKVIQKIIPGMLPSDEI